MLGLLLALLLAAAPARAELSESEADDLFQRGLTAFDQGGHTQAVELWEKLVLEGDPARVWRVLYNLGLAYEALGDRPRALMRFEAFSRSVGEQPGSLPIEFEGRRQDAVERSARIRPNVSMLRIAASTTGERVRVRINGEAPRDAPFATYLEPGAVALEMGDGVRKVTREITLEKGQLFTLTATQLPPPPPPPPKPPPPYRPPVPVSLLILGGSLSAATLALPAGLFVRAQGLRDDAEALSLSAPQYPARRDAYEQARTVYLGSWAVPATLAAATLALLVVDVVDASRDARVRAARLGFGSQTVELEVSLW